ncbi:MAG: hypothetical protein RIE31_02285 [Alphaproteobacteria bacterium]
MTEPLPARPACTMTGRSLQVLLDLIDIKQSCMQVMDRDDAREMATLEFARRELLALAGGAQPGAQPGAEMTPPAKRRGRKPKTAPLTPVAAQQAVIPRPAERQAERSRPPLRREARVAALA